MCCGEEEWKTECMCLNEWEIVVRVKMQGAEAVTADEFKYLGSTIQSNWQPHKRGGERRIAAKENITVYNLVRHVLDVWFGDVALTEIWEAHLEVAELKFLRILLEVIRLERIGNEWTSNRHLDMSSLEDKERQGWDGLKRRAQKEHKCTRGMVDIMEKDADTRAVKGEDHRGISWTYRRTRKRWW